MAQRVNLAHQGIVIGAWDIDQLPEEWLDAMMGFVDDLPGMSAQFDEFERRRAAWRKKFKGAAQ